MDNTIEKIINKRVDFYLKNGTSMDILMSLKNNAKIKLDEAKEKNIDKKELDAKKISYEIFNKTIKIKEKSLDKLEETEEEYDYEI